MLAFHNDPSVKEAFLERIRRHRAADEILQHYGYWAGSRGCAVGCTIHGNDHFAYERELGIPVILAKLEDQIFEGLPPGKAQEWPEAFLSAIRPGANLTKVWLQFAFWLLDDPNDGVIRFAKTPKTKKAVQRVATLYRRQYSGKNITAARRAAAAATPLRGRGRWRRSAAADAYVKQSEKLLELLRAA